MHSLRIVQWNSTRRDHPGNPGGVSGSGPVTGAWYMMSRVSFHGMACRIIYRIGMFFLECECEMLSEHCICT